MSWSYSGVPGSSDKDQVRFLIQDTVFTDQLLTDEEIIFLLDSEGSPRRAAVTAAETIGGQFARKCDETVGPVKVSFSQKSKQYFELAAKLKRRADIRGAVPFSGGLDISQKDTQRDDDNRVQPIFRRELHDIRRSETDKSVGRAVQEEEDD